MLDLLAIAAGGATGALARYGLSAWIQRRLGPGFPLGTLVVNLVGCLLIGVVLAVVAEHEGLTPRWRLAVVVGLLGSFTTFSTFGYDTVGLLRDGLLAPALGNVAAHVVLGLAAVVAGQLAARAVLA